MLIVIVSLRSVTVPDMKSRFYVCDGGVCVCVCAWIGMVFIAIVLDETSILVAVHFLMKKHLPVM